MIVGRIDDQVSSGTAGAGTAVGFDQPGTFCVEQDWPDGHSLGDPFNEEGNGPPALFPPWENVDLAGSIPQKLGVLIVG